jgi:hypothetical protein
MGQLVFQAALGGQVNLIGPNTASTFNLNVPAATDTLVGRATTDTLTNKTLTSPVVSGGTIDNAVIGGTTTAAGSFTTLSYSSTLTGGTGIVNLGSGQFYKDASGNVGIGTASPTAGYKLDVQAAQALINLQSTTGTNAVYHKLTNTGGDLYFGRDNSTGSSFSSGAYSTVLYSVGAYPVVFNINGTERMRIDSSGNLLVGTTTATVTPSQGLVVGPNTNALAMYLGHASGVVTGSFYLGFNYNSSIIGSITQNGTTGVLYNLTSDYRLKNDQQPLTGAKEFVMALQPKKWQWWDGSGEGVGFIAHEFMEIAKYSGHGKKDAVEIVEIKDEDGNVTGTEQRPIYQSIQPSSSEVMANIVALIQEQQTLITQLQADVAALKAPK